MEQKQLPTPVPGFWLTQSALPIAQDFLGWLLRNQQQLGNLYGTKMLNTRLVVAGEPEHAKHVLQQNNKNYHKSLGYEVLRIFLGEGLLTSEGSFWMRQRRLAQPAFHKKRLAKLAHFMQEESVALADEWEQRMQANAQFDLKESMMAVTIKIVARALFSADVTMDIDTIRVHLDRLNVFAVKRINSVVKLPMWMPTLRSYRYRESRDAINGVIFRIIEERRNQNESHDDLLEMLMEAKDEDTGEQMNNAQLRDECITIFSAGHETTAVSMTWLFYELARNPGVFDQLKAELDAVLGGRTLELGDLPQLKYTRAVVDEILRLYPPAWVLGRKSLEEDEIDGCRIPKGTNVLLPVYLLHHDAELWERPEEFWPGRWETERVKALPRMAYMPFGGGPRLCIGNNFALMEMVILLATLAQRFRPQLVDEMHPGLNPLITLHPKRNIPIHLQPA